MLKPILNIRMLLLALIVISISQTGTSQIVIDSKFKPLSYEELMMQAQAEAAYNAQMKQRFEQYQDEAYRRYNKQDWYGFLTYSNYALETGWYNSQLYYDRGVVYERLNNFKQAKKEYKKAKLQLPILQPYWEYSTNLRTIMISKIAFSWCHYGYTICFYP